MARLISPQEFFSLFHMKQHIRSRTLALSRFDKVLTPLSSFAHLCLLTNCFLSVHIHSHRFPLFVFQAYLHFHSFSAQARSIFFSTTFVSSSFRRRRFFTRHYSPWGFFLLYPRQPPISRSRVIDQKSYAYLKLGILSFRGWCSKRAVPQKSIYNRRLCRDHHAFCYWRPPNVFRRSFNSCTQ